MAASSNDKIIKEFRENAGHVGGWFAKMPLLLLTTLGAKTGLARVSPVAYLMDGEHYIIVASKGGSPTNPSWFHNLVVNPEVKVEVGNETFTATASVAEGAEHHRLYTAMATLHPQFADYQKKTDRKIPVVVLTRQ